MNVDVSLEPQLRERGEEEEEVRERLCGGKMILHSWSKSNSPSLDSNTSADGGESLLDELLQDIRRSRTTSVASTPTHMSSDCDFDVETDGARDCGRSEAELRRLSVSQLVSVCGNLEHDVDTVSKLLVRLLHVRDKRAGRLVGLHDKLSSILKNYARHNKLSSDLHFSLHPPETEEDHRRWLVAWIVLSRLPKGIPKRWRKTLWSCAAEYGTQSVEWQSQFHTLFSEYSTPEDETLGTQIVKDLHRTGTTGFTTDEEHAVLKRVLLAYARHNKAIGYCQGINILTALILKVVGFDEHMSLVILAYLIDFILPENYFAQNLYALSADMAVFRTLLRYYLPELGMHMESLQKEASGNIKKSYSSDNPPDLQSIHAYEPPLADVFSMQWFLTMFAAVLPRKACRRVWDAIFLEGSEFLLYTAVAILAVMEKDLLQTGTAADFYCAMSRLCDRMRKVQLLSSAEFLQVVYAVHGCITSPEMAIPSIQALREKYTYNIYPCGVLSDGGEGRSTPERPMAPLPSRGGAFAADNSMQRGREDERKRMVKKKKKEKEEVEEEGKETRCVNWRGCLAEKEAKNLRGHYSIAAQQPTKLRCNLHLIPPTARAVCPQQQRDRNPIPYYTAYAADVPMEVIHQSRTLSGFDILESLQDHRRDLFTLSFSQSPPPRDQVSSVVDLLGSSVRDVERAREREKEGKRRLGLK